MKNLKRPALINTAVKPETISKIKKAIPKLSVDEGRNPESADRAAAARAWPG